MKNYTTQIVLLPLLFLGLVACRPGEQIAEGGEAATAVLPTATFTPVPSPTTLPPTPTAPPTREPLERVRQATIRIESEGVFIDPEIGAAAIAGSGSGFIIDPSGLAITNNHVVTGAAFLKVWVADEAEPRNAQILGASECSDLALIDIDGENFDYLDWYEGDIRVGLDIFAAGFPLGDPEFTLTRGIISKARANGQTSWASVAAVLEHDATINPGNSGGPLITAAGEVVAVNYAGNAAFNQYFAIARDEVREILDQLAAGQDVDSIGINGVAVQDGDSFSGIWINSVKSGSPADKTGLQPGDIILTLEGSPVAEDGTMSSYCNVLRSHMDQSAMAIELYRPAAGAVFEGQINGKALVEKEPSLLAGSFSKVRDDSGAIQVEIPEAWGDIDGAVWQSEDFVFGSGLFASSDIEAFWNSFTTPGVFIGVSQTLAETVSAAQLLNDIKPFGDACIYEERRVYEDDAHSGLYDLFSDCERAGTLLYHIVLLPADASYLIMITFKGVSGEEGLDAVAHVLETLQIKPAVITAGTPRDGTLFTTEFDDMDDWFVFTVPRNEKYTAESREGVLYLELPQTDTTVYSMYDNLRAENVQIAAHVETVAGPNFNNISLVCRYGREGWYEFSMDSGGYWTIWKYEEDGDGYTVLADGASFAINLQKAANELTAVCQDTSLTFFVNDTLLGTAEDSQFTSGLIGVSVSTFDIPGAGVAFDWLRVTVPEQE